MSNTPQSNNENTDKVRTMFTIKTRLVAIGAAVALGAGLVAVSAAPSEAASVSISSAPRINAPDIKSKGTIKTPTVKTSGNVSVSSRSYKITKGKKTVAKTSTQGKTYKVKPGTYKVKTTVKYRTYTTKKVKTGSKTEWQSVYDWPYEKTGWSNTYYWRTEGNGKKYLYWEPYVTNKYDGSTIGRWDCELPWPNTDRLTYQCVDSEGQQWRGGVRGDRFEGWRFDAQERLVTKSTYKTVKKYSKTKTVTKTQTVKISNSGAMTQSSTRR